MPCTDGDTVARILSLRVGEREYEIVTHYKHAAAVWPDFGDGGSWSHIRWLSVLTHQLAEWLGVPIVAKTDS